jgi:hypothetical protein
MNASARVPAGRVDPERAIGSPKNLALALRAETPAASTNPISNTRISDVYRTIFARCQALGTRHAAIETRVDQNLSRAACSSA